MTVENQNTANTNNQEHGLTTQAQAALLQSEIEGDRQDLQDLIAEGSVTPEEVAVFKAEIDEKQLLLGFFSETLSHATSAVHPSTQSTFESPEKKVTKNLPYHESELVGCRVKRIKKLK